MSAEPIPTERLAAMRQLDLATLLPQSEKWAPQTRLQAARWLQQLKPVLHELVDEIASAGDEVAVLAKTVDIYEAALGLAEGDSLTAWRAEYDGIPLGTYLAVEEAQAHCEAVRATTPHPVGWYEDGDEPSTLRLYIDYDDEELDSGYAVVPVLLLAAYDPDGDE